MLKRIIYLIFLSLLLIDFGYSFKQYYNQTLDGDIAYNVVPAKDVEPIFESPFGFDAVLKNQTYVNPNRFFCHWMQREYLIAAPLILQAFVDPISSVYLSSAIAKISIHILLLFLLAMTVTGSTKLLSLEFIIAALLMAPFFQVNGYRSYMGIIDPSITYTFFYALPLAFLIMYFMPFIFQFYHRSKVSLKPIVKILWIFLSLVVCLSGPINPGIVLTFCLLIMVHFLMNNSTRSIGYVNRVSELIMNVPKNYWFYAVPVVVLSIYSLFLGSYNSLTIASEIPLTEMYLKLPSGIYYQFTQKLGFPILFLILGLNSTIIKFLFYSAEGKRILNVFKWIGIFSLCYIVLLPLGGYRDYRPNILRYDTILPITLSLMFVFGSSTLFIFKNLKSRQRFLYLPVILGVMFVFINADKPNFENNNCERMALQKIASSTSTIVALNQDCTVVNWDNIQNPEDSKLNAQLLVMWNITDRKKLYFNK